MEGIGLVLFIVFIIVSLIEQASKAGKQNRPGQRPPQRMPPGSRPGLPVPRPDSPSEPGASWQRESLPDLRTGPLPAADGERSAAEMVAEDFWRELTGQPPRPRPVPAPPAPAPQPEAASWDEEAVRRVEAPPPEAAPRRESASWEYRRPEAVHEPPVVVSLEETLPEPVARHAAYHRRAAESTAAAAKAASLAVATGSAASPLLRRLRRGEGLKESIVLAEVFGRPRGLEEHSPDR